MGNRKLSSVGVWLHQRSDLLHDFRGLKVISHKKGWLVNFTQVWSNNLNLILGFNFNQTVIIMAWSFVGKLEQVSSYVSSSEVTEL